MSLKPILVAICFSLALFLLLFMVWPKYQELQDINKQIKKAETQLEEREDHIGYLEELSSRLDKHEVAEGKINSALPSEPGLPNLLNFLHEAGSDSGLLLRRVGPVSQTSQGNIKEVTVDLQVRGSYSAFKDFVKTIEKSARIIDVKQLSFQTPEEEENKTSKFKLKVTTHFYNSQ